MTTTDCTYRLPAGFDKEEDLVRAIRTAQLVNDRAQKLTTEAKGYEDQSKSTADKTEKKRLRRKARKLFDEAAEICSSGSGSPIALEGTQALENLMTELRNSVEKAEKDRDDFIKMLANHTVYTMENYSDSLARSSVRADHYSALIRRIERLLTEQPTDSPLETAVSVLDEFVLTMTDEVMDSSPNLHSSTNAMYNYFKVIKHEELIETVRKVKALARYSRQYVQYHENFLILEAWKAAHDES